MNDPGASTRRCTYCCAR
jgi:hypothetical protein